VLAGRLAPEVARDQSDRGEHADRDELLGREQSHEQNLEEARLRQDSTGHEATDSVGGDPVDARVELVVAVTRLELDQGERVAHAHLHQVARLIGATACITSMPRRPSTRTS